MLLYLLVDAPLPGPWNFNQVLRQETFAAGVFFWLAERLKIDLTLKYGEADVQVVRYSDEDLRGDSLKLSVGLPEEVHETPSDVLELTTELEAQLEAMLGSGSVAEYATFFARNAKAMARKLSELFP